MRRRAGNSGCIASRAASSISRTVWTFGMASSRVGRLGGLTRWAALRHTISRRMACFNAPERTMWTSSTPAGAVVEDVLHDDTVRPRDRLRAASIVLDREYPAPQRGTIIVPVQVNVGFSRNDVPPAKP